MFTCPSAITAMLIALHTGAPDPVTIATEASSYTPYVLIDPSGRVTGFEKDIVDEVCARANLGCSWAFDQFDRLIPGVASGKYDVALGGIAVTEERLRVVDFSLSYNEPSDLSNYLGRPDAPPPDQALIGVQAGTIYESAMLKQNRRYKAFPTVEAVTSALLAGEVDLMLGGLASSEESELAAREGLVSKGAETIEDLGTAMVICKGNVELKTRIDTALNEMMADGTLDDITDRWFH